MPVLSQGDLFAALARGSFDDLIGTQEADWLEFKLTGYQVDRPRWKWALARDVAALANSRGGCLVLGVETRRESDEITDTAVAVRPIRRSTVDPQKYLDTVHGLFYPHVDGIRTHWFPPSGTEEAIFVIEVPPPASQTGFVLVTRTLVEEDRELTAFTVVRRDGTRVVTLTPGEIHRLLADGQRSSISTAPVNGSEVDRRPDQILDELELAQEWGELAVLFLQAIPSTTSRLAGFYEEDGMRGALGRHKPVRAGKHGFNLRLHDSLKVDEGALQYLADYRRAIRIERSGLFTFGMLATPAYLAWATEALAQPGTSQAWLNSIALVESVVEFYRFLEQEILPAASPITTWRSRVVGRRFESGQVCLRAGVPSPMALPMMVPTMATAENWEHDVPVSGRPEVDSFQAVEEIYAVFGLGISAIPFTDDGTISFDALNAI
jgi:hypothetical protein